MERRDMGFGFGDEEDIGKESHHLDSRSDGQSKPF